jgi:hypothetical protein
MSDHISYQGNESTRGATPVQFFEAVGGSPSAGAKATPRPTDRPREVPPSGPASAAFQLFQCEGPSGAEGAKATTRPAGSGR